MTHGGCPIKISIKIFIHDQNKLILSDNSKILFRNFVEHLLKSYVLLS